MKRLFYKALKNLQKGKTSNILNPQIVKYEFNKRRGWFMESKEMIIKTKRSNWSSEKLSGKISRNDRIIPNMVKHMENKCLKFQPVSLIKFGRWKQYQKMGNWESYYWYQKRWQKGLRTAKEWQFQVWLEYHNEIKRNGVKIEESQSGFRTV